MQSIFEVFATQPEQKKTSLSPKGGFERGLICVVCLVSLVTACVPGDFGDESSLDVEERRRRRRNVNPPVTPSTPAPTPAPTPQPNPIDPTQIDPPPVVPPMTGTTEDCGAVFGLCPSGSRTGFGTGTAYYLSNSGSDANNGSINSPFKSLSKGLGVLKPGDTLYIRGGSYNVYIANSSFTSSGTASSRIYVSGYPGETAVLDSGNSKDNALYLSSRSNITFRNLEVRNYARVALQMDGSANDLHFENIYLHDIGKGGNNSYSSGFEFKEASGLVVRNSRLDNIGKDELNHGVYLGNRASNCVVTSNFMTNISGGGVHTWHDKAAINLLVSNNVFGNTLTGVILGDGSHHIQVLNNTIYDSRTWSIEIYDYGEESQDPVQYVDVYNNIMHGARGLSIQSGVTNAHAGNNLYSSSAATFKFVNLAEGDLRLQAGSPAINAGTPWANTPLATISEKHAPVDAVGSARPAGGAFDIGAYEQ